MDQIFCTLFDSNYLDKGLTLYYSMCTHIKDFTLYVLAFDDKCYEILQREQLDNMRVISLEEFETEQLKKVKKERTRAEYCWTCSPWIIKYVLEKCNETICTYIDADMAFFNSPQPIFDDMRKKGDSVIIVPHRFNTDEEERYQGERIGYYCVQFNTFLKDKNGLQALNWWANQCLEWCFYAVPGTTQWYGDQKYLNVFPKMFNGVYICNHYGVGLAPWNIKRVKLDSQSNKCSVVSKETGKTYPIIIYHYENVAFATKHILNMSSRTTDSRLRHAIYNEYVKRLLYYRKHIEETYDFVIPRTHRVLTNNAAMKIYQKYICPLRRIKRINDLVWVR